MRGLGVGQGNAACVGGCICGDAGAWQLHSVRWMVAAPLEPARALALCLAATHAAATDPWPATDRVLEQELIPVQRAINSLAQGGAQLEAGDVKAAAGTLRCAHERVLGLGRMLEAERAAAYQRPVWAPPPPAAACRLCPRAPPVEGRLNHAWPVSACAPVPQRRLGARLPVCRRQAVLH